MPDCTGAQTSSTSREVMFTAIDKTQLQNEPAAVPPPAGLAIIIILTYTTSDREALCVVYRPDRL